MAISGGGGGGGMCLETSTPYSITQDTSIQITNFSTYSITSNYRQMWRPDQKKGLVVSIIVEMSVNRIALVKSVRVRPNQRSLPVMIKAVLLFSVLSNDPCVII